MNLASGDLAATVVDGPLVVALAVSAAAGLVSFLSPCVLPLVPGYISYVTGIAGADLDAAVGSDPSGRPVPPRAATPGGAGTLVAERRRVRGRVLLGSGLFVAGFTAVFTLIGATVGGVATALYEYRPVLEKVVGGLIIVLGLAFVGLIPGLQREARIRRLPATGLAGAPLLGVVFGLGWVPCVSPTLSAVLGLASTHGTVGRGVALTVAYCLGLGLPFILFGLGFRRLLGALAVIRRHSVWVTRAGGAMLVAVGLLLLTGAWNSVVIWLYDVFGQGEILF
ncbi:MAG TPA: cytochrome c biogenesis protein CcdA [Kribbellaceae bacterium]